MLASLWLSVRLLACSLVPGRHLDANRSAVTTKFKKARFSRVYPTTDGPPDGNTIFRTATSVMPLALYLLKLTKLKEALV